MVVPQNGWCTSLQTLMENPIEMDDLVAPPFMETPKTSDMDHSMDHWNQLAHHRCITLK